MLIRWKKKSSCSQTLRNEFNASHMKELIQVRFGLFFKDVGCCESIKKILLKLRWYSCGGQNPPVMSFQILPYCFGD